jgi:hypothetical protein
MPGKGRAADCGGALIPLCGWCRQGLSYPRMAGALVGATRGPGWRDVASVDDTMWPASAAAPGSLGSFSHYCGREGGTIAGPGCSHLWAFSPEPVLVLVGMAAPAVLCSGARSTAGWLGSSPP